MRHIERIIELPPAAITERQRLEEQLHDSAERLRLALEAGRMGVWEWKLASGQVSWCPSLEAIHGLAPGSFGGTFEDHLGDIHPDDRAAVLQSLTRSVEQKAGHEIEYRIVWPDGSIHWLECKGRMVEDANGKAAGMTGVCTDITGRKQADEERTRLLLREQAARAVAEQANRLKDVFLATVSHELRTPLTAVLGWVRLLRGGAVDESLRNKALESIERSTRAQAKLIDDLLDVSRIISGKLRLQIDSVDLRSTIEKAIETMRPAADAKGIQITKRIDAGAGEVLADQERLQQVMLNLLSNAVKFTPEKGRVEVRLKRLGAKLQIEVSDTGDGIAAEFLPHLFEPFRQADTSSARPHGGLGLGTAIVRHLVELHGGSVTAHSAGLGKGATFTVRLPISPVDRDTGEARQPAAPLGGARILLVEDDQDTQNFLTAVLRDYGAIVKAVGSAEAALQAFAPGATDVLVCDLGLPGEDGLTLIRRLRALGAARGGDVPALALTAYTRDEDREQALAAGFQMHMAKPIDTVRLARTIEHLIRANQTI